MRRKSFKLISQRNGKKPTLLLYHLYQVSHNPNTLIQRGDFGSILKKMVNGTK